MARMTQQEKIERAAGRTDPQTTIVAAKTKVYDPAIGFPWSTDEKVTLRLCDFATWGKACTYGSNSAPFYGWTHGETEPLKIRICDQSKEAQRFLYAVSKGLNPSWAAAKICGWTMDKTDNLLAEG
jgi:hypothetical protein